MARADIPPPNLKGCEGKQAGDACQNDQGDARSCAKAICSRNDYSNGPPPTQVTYECLMCAGDVVKPATAPPAPKKDGCAAVPGASLAALAALLFLRRRSQERA